MKETRISPLEFLEMSVSYLRNSFVNSGNSFTNIGNLSQNSGYLSDFDMENVREEGKHDPKAEKRKNEKDKHAK